MPGIAATVCPVDRYNINDLAALLQNPASKLAKEDVAEVLSRSVNINKERMSKEHRQKYTAETSISAYEADAFIRKLMVSGQIEGGSAHAQIARGLDRIFFGGKRFAELPPRNQVKIDTCHDGDTCTFAEPQAAACNAGPSTVSVRTSGVDAPEVGIETYSEARADAARGKNSPYGRSFAAAALGGASAGVSLEDECDDMPLEDKPANMAPKEKREPFINGKYVGNVDEVHVALAKKYGWDPKKIAYKEREAINYIIAATIDYTGKIATIPRSDLLTWEPGAGGIGAENFGWSQVRWTSADMDPVFCGKWQSYDIYGRLIGSFYQQDSTRLARYLRTRLPVVMAGAAPALKASYLSRVDRFVKAIESSSNQQLKDAMKEILATVPDVAKVYSAENCAKIADLFDAVVKQFGVGADDDQLMQIATGSVYSYLKYRNQYGELYKAAGDASRAQGLGLWGETTFRTVWDVNATKPRYDPPDCQKK